MSETSQVKEPEPVAPVPVPAVASVPATPASPDYYYPQQLHPSHGQPAGNPLTQIELPLYQDNQGSYQIETVTPKFHQNRHKYVTIYPVLDELRKHQHQYVPQDKVQIYPQGEQKLDVAAGPGTNIQSLHHVRPTVHPQYDAKLLPQTLVPYNNGHILKGYQNNLLVSTVAPQHYSGQVYVTTPRYNVVPSNQHYYK